MDVQIKDNALYINDMHSLPNEIDYTNNDSVKGMATKAAQTADGFYKLIKSNCNTSDPDISSNAHLEMYLALAGLTCEIYMKSILYFENRHGGKKCKGHKLDELFAALPNNHINTIKRRITDIENELPSIGDAFEILRYDYELNHIKGQYLLLFDLMDELKKISDSYPKKTIAETRYASGALAIE